MDDARRLRPVTHDELVFDIQLAIGLNLKRIPRKGEHLTVDASKPLAEIIATKLETSGCKIFREHPGLGPTTPKIKCP
ncbi:MAG: hypothetical protein JWL84_5184 [Rhodospirillales bacterium]|nr:hypothetical protein [Rhodospirillales bacterium]